MNPSDLLRELNNLESWRKGGGKEKLTQCLVWPDILHKLKTENKHLHKNIVYSTGTSVLMNNNLHYNIYVSNFQCIVELVLGESSPLGVFYTIVDIIWVWIQG